MLNAKQVKTLRSAETVGNRVAAAIEIAGLTQMEVATALGIPQPYVSDVVRNRYQTITVENAHKFAEFFGCTIEDLFPARDQTEVA